MNFLSSLEDLFNRKKELNKNSLPSAPELQQGITFLNSKNKMCKSLRRRSKLMEGFTSKSDIDFQKAVSVENSKEMQELEEMQKSFSATMSAWSDKYNSLVKYIKNQPKEYQDCIAKCKKGKDKSDVTACLYGCNVGQFASGSTAGRAGSTPSAGVFGIFVDNLKSVSNGTVVSNLLSNATETGTLGTYGDNKPLNPGEKRHYGANKINKALASEPQPQTHRHKAYDDAYTLSDMEGDNPKGLRTIMTKAETNARDTFLKLLGNLNNEPLAQQMAKVTVSKGSINTALTKMKTQWKNTFRAACEPGIGGVGGESGSFGGHPQYCAEWINTKQGRSGAYGEKHALNTQNYLLGGSKFDKSKDNLVAGRIDLTNGEFVSEDDKLNNRFGCDMMIPGTRSNDSVPGGSGYCLCADGTTGGYADKGHPGFSCNAICAPQNKTQRTQQPIWTYFNGRFCSRS